ncbi:MAG: hypothetical protein A2W35_19020 [Chloroflexi bacterium RBG_16_57_11]|nr:MAG: hypothetical protein A2W35_19020 [Chloroflexi bacterium RBG_16_57_11]
MTDHMTTCERCGSAVPAGASVCPSCGAPVGASAYETRKVDAGWSEPEIPLPAEPEPPAYEPTVKIPEPLPAEPASPVYSRPAHTPPPYTPSARPEAPKRNWVWQIVAGCVALLLICCCLVVVASVIIFFQAGGF